MSEIKVEPMETISFEEAMAMLKAEREIPSKMTLADYTEAVTQLAQLAMSGCGSSRVAAQVLLGTYNGNSWHVNLVDLCHLDAAHYRSAIIVIRSRVEINREPHEVIANGDAIFETLQDEWKHYHVKRRYQPNN